MAKMLANELGPDNITVNNVAPGIIWTDRLKETLFKYKAPGLDEASVIAERTRDIPLRRVGQPEEVASLVLFLASAQAGYISGTTIPIDGGAVKSTF